MRAIENMVEPSAQILYSPRPADGLICGSQTERPIHRWLRGSKLLQQVSGTVGEGVGRGRKESLIFHARTLQLVFRQHAEIWHRCRCHDISDQAE